MEKSVIMLDGAVGVGKTSLGRAAAERLGVGFLDGDDYAVAGQWLRTILQTSRKIVAAAQEVLTTQDTAIISYPLRCTNWIYYKARFERMGVHFYSIGLWADITAIDNRARRLSFGELARSREMLAQGYGQHRFHDQIIRTDLAGFDDTARGLARDIKGLVGGRDGEA